jgi:hypothetical protein
MDLALMLLNFFAAAAAATGLRTPLVLLLLV